MKLKKIAALCKAAKSIIIYEKESLQYIGTSNAVYTMHGLAPLDTESAFIIFDVTEKQKADYFCKTLELPKGISFEDYAACENMVEQTDLRITHKGYSLMPIQTSAGITFINEEYLEPLVGESELMELYERFPEDGGQPYIVAKAGFMLLAVIMPYNCINEAFCKKLTELASACDLALQVKATRKAALQQTEDSEQIQFKEA